VTPSVHVSQDLLAYDLADVFTEAAFAGNQLSVVYAADLDDSQMQRLGQEFNLSETVIVETAEPVGKALHSRVRLFTATVEVPFAGHPLLGCAALLSERHNRTNEVVLHAPGGTVPVRVEHLGPGRYNCWMEHPLPTVRRYGQERELLSALGLERSELPVLTYDAGIAHVYVMAPSVREVAAIRPDFALLRTFVGPHRINVFAVEGSGLATTRMFSAFDAAMPEDPACGSAAGPLAAHLVRHGLLDSGALLTLSQGEQVGRPSTLVVEAHCQGQEIRSIRVGGGVCWTGSGHILRPGSLR